MKRDFVFYISIIYYLIRIDKPSYLGIIIPGIEIIPARLGIVVISTIPDGVDIGNVKRAGDGIATGVGDGEDFTPSVIGILRHHIAIGIQDCNDIPWRFFGRHTALHCS